MNQRQFRKLRGFTLIELMTTLTIVTVLSGMTLPMQELTVKRGKEAELRTALRQIREALDTYRQAGEDGRIVVIAGESGYPKSLSVLVEGVKDAKRPDGAPIRFLRRIPRDPFADKTVKDADTWGQRSYRSDHTNPRRGDDIYDVYSQSDGVGINGIAYRRW